MPRRPGPLRILVLTLALFLAGTVFSLADDRTVSAPAQAESSLTTLPPLAPPMVGPFALTEPVPWAEYIHETESVPWARPASLTETIYCEQLTPWAEYVPCIELVPWAEPAPWPAPVPWTEPTPWAEVAPPRGYLAAMGRTMDRTHAMIERGLLHQTIRLDNFFGSEKSPVLRPPAYELRVRGSARIEHGGNVNFGATMRGSIVLSRLDERLRLFFARENEPGITTPSIPQDPGQPGLDRTTPTAHFTNTELRYDLIRKPTLNLFVGAGVQITSPLEAFIRTRIQYSHKLGDLSLMKVAETFFLKSSDLLGETTEFSLERLIFPKTILRWSTSGTASQEIEGLEWGSELSLWHELSPKSAITLTGGIYGNTSVSHTIDNYRLSVLYRRNFLRKWLFYELEPEVTWPRDVNGSHPSTYAFTFRLEVVFQGTAPKDVTSPPHR